MRPVRVVWTWFLIPAALLPQAVRGQEKLAADGQASGVIVVPMEDCKASRPGRISKGTSILSLLFRGGPRDEEMAKKGSVTIDGRSFGIYLPRAAAYPLKNTGERDDAIENTSTLISIDLNGDGKLEDAEGWYANLPVRLGDRMFDVREISKNGDRIVLSPSAAPLRGLIEGFRCPPFDFQSDKGQHITRDQFAGKAFLLDVWSVT